MRMTTESRFWAKKSPLEETRGEIGLFSVWQLISPRLFIPKFSLGKFWDGKRRRGRFKEPSSSTLCMGNCGDLLSRLRVKKLPPEQTRGDFGSSVTLVVEPRGIEPLSENPSTQLSPSAVCLLKFPHGSADKQAQPLGIL